MLAVIDSGIDKPLLKRNFTVFGTFTDKVVCRKFYDPVQFVFKKAHNKPGQRLQLLRPLPLFVVCAYHIIENSPKRLFTTSI